jgi:hypothetical protein
MVAAGYINNDHDDNHDGPRQGNTYYGSSRGACRWNGYQGIPVHLLLGPVIGPSSAQGRINSPGYGEDPHEETPRKENDDENR